MPIRMLYTKIKPIKKKDPYRKISGYKLKMEILEILNEKRVEGGHSFSSMDTIVPFNDIEVKVNRKFNKMSCSTWGNQGLVGVKNITIEEEKDYIAFTSLDIEDVLLTLEKDNFIIYYHKNQKGAYIKIPGLRYLRFKSRRLRYFIEQNWVNLITWVISIGGLTIAIIAL